jgi:hypothetical protein
MKRNISRLPFIIILLCAVGIGTTYASTEILQAAGEASKLAADKDIVRLAIMLAMAALLFASWIIKMWVAQNEKRDAQRDAQTERFVKALEHLASAPCPKDAVKQQKGVPL